MFVYVSTEKPSLSNFQEKWFELCDNLLTFMRGRGKNYERFMSEKNPLTCAFLTVYERPALGNLQHVNQHIHE